MNDHDHLRRLLGVYFMSHAGAQDQKSTGTHGVTLIRCVYRQSALDDVEGDHAVGLVARQVSVTLE